MIGRASGFLKGLKILLQSHNLMGIAGLVLIFNFRWNQYSWAISGNHKYGSIQFLVDQEAYIGLTSLNSIEDHSGINLSPDIGSYFFELRENENMKNQKS